MANTNSPYIAKNAAPLVNPTTATVFQQTLSAIATVASTQVPRTAYIRYAGYAQGGINPVGAGGTSNNINIVRVAARASGRVTYGAAGSFTPSIVLGPSGMTPPLPTATFTTLGALTPLAASGAGVGTWAIDLSLLWDPNSGVISGTVSGFETTFVAGTAASQLTASTAITPATGYIATPPLTSLPTTQAQAIAQINNGGEMVLFSAVTGLFSATNANNVALLDDFEWEVL